MRVTIERGTQNLAYITIRLLLHSTVGERARTKSKPKIALFDDFGSESYVLARYYSASCFIFLKQQIRRDRSRIPLAGWMLSRSILVLTLGAVSWYCVLPCSRLDGRRGWFNV